MGTGHGSCFIEQFNYPIQSGWGPEEMWRENEEKVCKCMGVHMYVCVGTCVYV